MKSWRCRVCGYVHKGSSPPKECPQCSSPSSEYIDISEQKILLYDGRKIDVLLVDGSSHSSHNTNILAETAEAELKKKKVSYAKINLNELDVQHCWCCYSMYDAACTYPCRNQLDDMPKLHEMAVNSKAIIICSPINWNNMSARLKDFLDRMTCLQNLVPLGKKSLTINKTVGILVNGHEDGALKTAMDIFIYFQQMGYIMAPFGFTYKTHGAENDTKTDHDYFIKNKKLKEQVVGVVDNVIEMISLDLENKLKGRIKGVCE